MGLLHKAVLCIGTLLFVHAAYSAGQYRSFLKLAEEEYSSLPSDIFLECIAASIFCMGGVILLTGNFEDINQTTELNLQSYDSLSNRTNFMIFNHRGKMVHGFLKGAKPPH